MQLFVDSANLRDIEDALRRGIAGGVTTNPSIFSHEQRRHFTQQIRDIASWSEPATLAESVALSPTHSR